MGSLISNILLIILCKNLFQILCFILLVQRLPVRNRKGTSDVFLIAFVDHSTSFAQSVSPKSLFNIFCMECKAHDLNLLVFQMTVGCIHQMLPWYIAGCWGPWTIIVRWSHRETNELLIATTRQQRGRFPFATSAPACVGHCGSPSPGPVALSKRPAAALRRSSGSHPTMPSNWLLGIGCYC